MGSNAAGVAEGRYGVQFVVGVEPHVVVANAVEGVLEPVLNVVEPDENAGIGNRDAIAEDDPCLLYPSDPAHD